MENLFESEVYQLKYCVIIYSPTCCSKPVWISLYCEIQKETFWRDRCSPRSESKWGMCCKTAKKKKNWLNIKRLGLVSMIQSWRLFYTWRTFRFKTLQDVFIHLDLCYIYKYKYSVCSQIKTTEKQRERTQKHLRCEWRQLIHKARR